MICLAELDAFYLRFFREHGYLVINPEREILNTCNQLLSSLKQLGQVLLHDDNFLPSDSFYVEKANHSNYYRYVRQLTELQELIGSKTIRKLVHLLGIEIPSLGPSAIRLDISQEVRHQFGWHQDAPSLLGSINMNTYWIPCTDVNEDLGTIELIPKSHLKLHIKTLDARDPHIAPKDNSSNLILDPSYAENLGTSIRINACRGSIIVIHPLLVHRSYYPKTIHPPRVTAILRVDDAGDKEHLSLGLKSLCSGYNIFNSPEYVTYYSNYCEVLS